MSHPPARLPMTAIRGHSSWIIAKCLWTSFPISPCSVHQVSITSTCMSLVSLVTIYIHLCSVSPCCCSIVSCFFWCLLCGFPCGLFLCSLVFLPSVSGSPQSPLQSPLQSGSPQNPLQSPLHSGSPQSPFQSPLQSLQRLRHLLQKLQRW